ncbi:MAG: hypothetical protein AB7E32_04870 [Desulfovibrio sp.]
MNGRMDGNRFKRILDAYGANPRRWPETERDAALAYMRTSPEAEALRERAMDLDLLLDAVPAAQPSEVLRRGVLAGRADAGGSVGSWGRWLADLLGDALGGLPARRMAATVLAASFLGGVALGVFGPTTTATATANASELWSGAFIAEIYTGY